MSVTRHGVLASAVGMILAASALLTAATIAAQTSARHGEVTARALRLQGREWCLGATNLSPGQAVVCGTWTITRTAEGERRAEHARGLYRITSTGQEQWRIHGGKP